MAALVILDYNRTLYDPDTDALVPGALELLEGLKKKGATMVLVSRHEGGRAKRILELGIEQYFEEAFIVEEKTEDLFRSIRRNYPHHQVFVIGDYLHEEIRFGNKMSAYTILFNQGKYKDMEPQGSADYPRSRIKWLVSALADIN